MILEKLNTISFGQRSYGPFTGLGAVFKLLVVIAIVSALTAIFVEGIYRWVAILLCSISSLSIYSNIRSRTSSPWRSHHFPLMTLWAGAMGAGHAMGDQSFGSVAPFFLTLAFPKMSEEAAKQLLELSKAPLFEAMKYFGFLNREKSIDSPEMIEFKRMTNDLEAQHPNSTRQTILFAMIIYRFEGQLASGKYLAARLNGDAF